LVTTCGVTGAVLLQASMADIGDDARRRIEG